ncbi:MAG: hypothetical protein J6W77_05350 [Prevotella sp.]|nr:hypothetical protein [Prevotella sp.]
MIRKKEKIKGQTFDKYGRLIDCETEVEEITCECVGDILDILADYPRSATVFMIPPKKGDNIQRVQVLDCVEERIDVTDGLSVPTAKLRKAGAFTIGTYGPYELSECCKKQKEREQKSE